MKKIIAVIALVLLVALGYSLRQRFVRPTTKSSTSTSEVILPSDWSQVADSKVDLKFEKKVDSGLKPQIVVKQVETDDAATPARYTDTIIAGARSAIPSLKIIDDKRTSTEKYYLAVLTGSYQNQKQKVSLLQRVYIKDKTVTVITASYTGELANEVNSILDLVAKNKFGL